MWQIIPDLLLVPHLWSEKRMKLLILDPNALNTATYTEIVAVYSATKDHHTAKVAESPLVWQKLAAKVVLTLQIRGSSALYMWQLWGALYIVRKKKKKGASSPPSGRARIPGAKLKITLKTTRA